VESKAASLYHHEIKKGVETQTDMNKLFKTIFLLLLASVANAQPSLKIEKGVRFQLTGDTFLLDSLVMEDSAVLLLDTRHKSCLIRANFFSVGTQDSIIGIGRDGKRGNDGVEAAMRSLDLPGKDGRSGTPGIHLTLNFSNLVLQNTLEIILYGGRGGDGGRGGLIYQHAATSAAERPNIGPGGNGGDGGSGGDVILSCPSDLEETVKDKIVIHAQGGIAGKSGTPLELKTPAWYYQYERNGVKGRKGKVTLLFLKR
jgi:hypothetical protein